MYNNPPRSKIREVIDNYVYFQENIEKKKVKKIYVEKIGQVVASDIMLLKVSKTLKKEMDVFIGEGNYERVDIRFFPEWVEVNDVPIPWSKTLLEDLKKFIEIFILPQIKGTVLSFGTLKQIRVFQRLTGENLEPLLTEKEPFTH